MAAANEVDCSSFSAILCIISSSPAKGALFGATHIVAGRLRLAGEANSKMQCLDWTSSLRGMLACFTYPQGFPLRDHVASNCLHGAEAKHMSLFACYI